MTARRCIPMLLALALAIPAGVSAQDPDPARARERAEAARQRLQEAQERLREALVQLERAQSEEANREMQRAMDALRRAQREMQAGLYQGLLRDFNLSTGEKPIVLAGTANRPRMGVLLGDDTFRPDSTGAHAGVRIEGVTPGGPAAEAGILTGDIIMTANGHVLSRRSRRDPSPNAQLSEIIGELEEGDTLHVVYRRDRERREAHVVVRPLDSRAFSFFTPGREQLNWEFREFAEPQVTVEVAPLVEGIVAASLRLPYRWLNMELIELDPEAGEAQFGTREGLLVVRPPEDSTLDLRAYDVILNVDGRVPSDFAHAIRIMRSYDVGETMNITVMRNRRRVTVTATVPDPREDLRLRVRERRPE